MNLSRHRDSSFSPAASLSLAIPGPLLLREAYGARGKVTRRKLSNSFSRGNDDEAARVAGPGGSEEAMPGRRDELVVYEFIAAESGKGERELRALQFIPSHLQDFPPIEIPDCRATPISCSFSEHRSLPLPTPPPLRRPPFVAKLLCRLLAGREIVASH